MKFVAKCAARKGLMTAEGGDPIKQQSNEIFISFSSQVDSSISPFPFIETTIHHQAIAKAKKDLLLF